MTTKLGGATNPIGREQAKKHVTLFGNFGSGNLGNEATLQATLYHLRRLVPNPEFTCICTRPATVAAAYNITALPSRDVVVKCWAPDNPLARLARRVILGIPREPYRWLQSFKTLWGSDAVIVPGTGVLTDACCLTGWGPYDLFRWAVAAKLCRAKLLFVSVGAGPVYSRAGRFFLKAALAWADFRSYRDESSKRYLTGMGVRVDRDPVYPDLVFSLPANVLPRAHDSKGPRPVVGLGLMEYAGRYSVERPTGAVYAAYLETLVQFAEWLLAHGYNIRLLVGDLLDARVTREFWSLLRQRSVAVEERRIVDEPAASVDDLLSHLAASDLVVATRFHNVLLSVLLNKPVIAISFHHKCTSLMNQMGLAEYCQDINSLGAEALIEQFHQLQRNAEEVRRTIRQRVEACRSALDEQYGVISSAIGAGGEPLAAPAVVMGHRASHSG